MLPVISKYYNLKNLFSHLSGRVEKIYYKIIDNVEIIEVKTFSIEIKFLNCYKGVIEQFNNFSNFV